jgi:hypothetical protein
MENKKLTTQLKEFEGYDNKTPFTNRVKTFIELYQRYSTIQFRFITDDTMNKKERTNLLYEIEIMKTNMNNILPDYVYPKKKG